MCCRNQNLPDREQLLGITVESDLPKILFLIFSLSVMGKQHKTVLISKSSELAFLLCIKSF
jgi:hypothetical protein